MEIKFRWKDKIGQTFYSRVEVSGGAMILLTEPTDKLHGYIDENSIAQLIGYDADGKEVYEGDKMISTINSDFETTAYLDVFPEQDSELRPDTFTKFVLKECGENENLS